MKLSLRLVGSGLGAAGSGLGAAFLLLGQVAAIAEPRVAQASPSIKPGPALNIPGASSAPASPPGAGSAGNAPAKPPSGAGDSLKQTPTLPSGQAAPAKLPPGKPAGSTETGVSPIKESSYKPVGPAKAGAAPESLNPDPNPLLFPTKPEEVKLRGTQPITLQQALELAERNNAGLQSQRLQIERAKAAIREEQASKSPTLTFSNDLTLTDQRIFLDPLGQRQVGFFGTRIESFDPNVPTNLTNNSQISFDYNLFDSGLRNARIQAAKFQMRSTELEVEAALEQLKLEVAGFYYDLQQADETVRINESAVRNSERSLKDAQALEKAGLGTRFDVLRSEVQLAEARQNSVNAIADQRTNRRRLAQVLTLNQSLDLAAADPVQLDRVADSWDKSLDESIVLAYKNRAELERSLVQRDISEAQRKAALAGRKPSLNFQGAYGVTIQTRGASQTPVDDLRVGLNLRWPLMDGGAAKARAKQQEINKEIAALTFADSRDRIRFNVERAYQQLLASLENIPTTEKAVTQAKDALRLARLRFEAGVGTQTDVLNADNDLTRAEGRKVNAILSYKRALVTLKREVSNVQNRVPSP
jgi:outer membrane protein TolC